jgi:transcriptional regulator with XRE-family HTH domain
MLYFAVIAEFDFRLGMTQAELADTLGVAENTVWRYEKGATSIPKHMALTLEALEARHIENLRHPIADNK